MAIAKMKLVDLTGDISKLDEVLSYFIDFQGFHPIESAQFVGTVHGLTSLSSNNPYTELLNEVLEIEQEYDLKLPEVTTRKLVDDIDQMHDYIQSSHQALQNEVAQIKELEAQVQLYSEAITQIQYIESLDISLDDLFSAKFVSVRFGKLPEESVERIKYYFNKPFVFVPFQKEDHDVWCMYLMTNEFEREVDNIMSSLFFQRIYIPEFVHGRPDMAKLELINQVALKTSQINQLKAHLFEVTSSYTQRLATIKGELLFLEKMYQTRNYVVGLGSKFLISGFILKSDVERFKDHFAGVNDLVIDIRPSSSDRRLTPPTKLKNNWFTRPFEMFVEMYGLPSYRDIDPTLFVALTYTLLFGIMFGDFGQGLVIAVIGFLLSKFKKHPLGPILTRIGISSAFFGLIYGSVFGNETWLEGIYHSLGITFLPIHVMSGDTTMSLLITTIILGAFLIVTAILTNIYVKFKNKEYAEGLCSANGVSGFVFYFSILIGALLQFGLQITFFTPIVIILLIVFPILVIFLKEPLERLFNKEKMFPEGIGGFFIEGFFELFEVVLSYITNTMSFLRVGGFVLSHAGMMLVVHTLMNMAGNAGIVVNIFGNLFVMGLEGLIVGIQVLRLEFYEMFSRYYEGNGIVFKPL